MPFRPSWQGHLRLSLVSCPVLLYPATSRGGDVHFHLINPKTHNRIRMIATDPDAGPVERSDLVKGYEVTKGEYVLLDDADLDAVKLESTKTIDVERFVAEGEIDRIYWDEPYYLAPDGKPAQEAFAVIREAMRQAGQIALARVVLSTRERILALEPRGKGLLATTIRSDAEVRDADEVFDDISGAKPDREMIQIAQKIIDQREGPFDPTSFVDRYEEALRRLIADKQKGRKPVRAAEPEDTNVVDLMSALRRSLDARKAPAARPAEAKPSRPRKTASRRR
jgi:DNA end-binding protein Ku